MLGLDFKIKRYLVKHQLNKNEKKHQQMIKYLSKEQLKVFNLINEFAVKYPSSIKFDPYSDEIILIIPNNETAKILVTLRTNEVTIENSNGYYIAQFPPQIYAEMVGKINKSAHMERSRLKREAKNRLNNFLNEIEMIK